MARITITRPNGETEYAELTTDKAQAGNDRLAVEKAGTVYYAKLDKGISTHMYVIKPDGRKLYVQKEVKFTWKYIIDGKWDNASKMVIPRTGKYKLTYKDTTYKRTSFPRVKEEIKIKYDIFEQGAKFISYSNTIIKSRTNKSYEYYYSRSIENSKGNSVGSYIIQLLEVEYIGEA